MTSARSISATLLVAASTAGLVACGSSGPGTAGAASKSASMLAFAHCMRASGVPNFPDPGGNGRGGLMIQQGERAGSGSSMTVNGVSVSAPAFQGAMQRCRSKLPNGGRPQPLSAGQRAAMLRFSHCMRAHGLTGFPDPTFSGNGGVGIRIGPSSGISPNSPAFQAAQRACSSTGAGFGFKTG
jgi:hypothetical protein